METDEAAVSDAIEHANSLVRDQIQILLAERNRLMGLLKTRETDLQQLQILLDDLTYSPAMVTGASTASRWVSRLDSLRSKEGELRTAIEKLSTSVKQVNSLLSALSSIMSLGDLSDPGTTAMDTAIAARMLQGQEAERARLAREVHDGPAQVLANAIMALEYTERLLEKRPGAVPDELRRIKSTMSDGLDEVRRFIFDLRPSSLEHEGLARTLERYARNFQSRFGIEVDVRCDDVDDILTSEQRFVVFRVVQEAMQNSRKHAEASAMEISVTHLGGYVEASVVDNGTGFGLENGRFGEGHYGLQGMRERAEAVRGQVVVFSEPGHGTEVRLRVPVELESIQQKEA